MNAKKLWEILGKISFCLLIAGLLFNFIGSVILISGALPSDEQINKISGTYFGHNKYLLESLEKNRDQAKKGLKFSSVGFLLELFGTLCSINKKEYSAYR